MSFERVHRSKSQTPQTSWSTSQFAPRPFPVQEPKRPPTQEELENQAFQQNKFEATGLQLKEKYGTITPVEQERLGMLQAKMDSFWAQRMERTKAQPNLLEILIRNAQSTQANEQANESTAPVQPKLTIGQPNDQYEQEADRVAEQVMSMAPPATPNIQRQTEEEQEEVQTKPLVETIMPIVQRQEALEEDEPIQAKCESCEAEEQVQRSPDGVPQVQADLENRLNASKGGGSPLPDEVRSFMEPRFKSDFSPIRVHTGDEAVQMNQELSAQAFTHKQDIYFGAGKAPGKDALTAHELTHTVQQTDSSLINPLLQQTALVLSEDKQALQSEAYANEPRLQDAFRNNPPMSYGETGKPVALVQKGLIEAGFSMPLSTKKPMILEDGTILPDGIFGSETFSKVKQFQRAFKKDVDGIVGKQTLGELDDLAAQITPNTPPTATPPIEQSDHLRNWPTLLEYAKRDENQHIQVDSRGDKNEASARKSLEGGAKPLIIPDTGQIPEYSKEQQDIVTQIEKNRKAKNSLLTDKNISVTASGQQKRPPYKGYSYGGKGTIRPSSLAEKEPLPQPGTTKGFTSRQIDEALFQEIGSEGGNSAIQTRDNAIFSWGTGLAHGKKQKGSLENFVLELFRIDPEVRDILLNVGIDCTQNGTWLFVNTTTGLIESGDDALQLLRFDREMLSVFISIAESKELAKSNNKTRQQNVGDAQWKAAKDHPAYKVKPEAKDNWTDINTIRFVSHCVYWGAKAQWEDFLGTGGDYRAAMRREVELLQHNTSFTRSDPVTGAVIVNSVGAGGNTPAATILNMADKYAINTGIVVGVSLVEPLDNSFIYFEKGKKGEFYRLSR
jgi:peptidoglycan hydrolase-like protein with peptidoglycan-binding domain